MKEPPQNVSAAVRRRNPHLYQHQVAQILSPPARPKPAEPRDDYASFQAWCAKSGIAEPVAEFPFAAPERKFRADFAWPDAKLLLEVEGGIWMKSGGGHSHPMHILKDMERSNEAAIRGYRMLRVTPQALLTEKTAELIKLAIAK